MTNAYTNSFSVLYIFEVDSKESAGMQKAGITSALQKVLAVQSELLVYESTAGELEKEYRDALQQQF